MSAANVQTLMDAAATAIANADWATAKSKAQQALAHLGAMPNGDKGDLALDWSQARSACQEIIGQANREIVAASASSGSGFLGGVRIKNVAPTSCP